MYNTQNTLYPVFFKLSKLKVLIVGAGEVGEEKLHFILKSSPDANITVVAPWAKNEVQAYIYNENYNIRWYMREFDALDVIDHDIIIAATNIKSLNYRIHFYGKENNKIVNVADTPELCDFYMGSIITRGDLKIAVSTNGKSPTFAKRFRQLLEDILPIETNTLINNLKIIRDELKGNFEEKVRQLNSLTESLIKKNHGIKKSA